MKCASGSTEFTKRILKSKKKILTTVYCWQKIGGVGYQMCSKDI